MAGIDLRAPSTSGTSATLADKGAWATTTVYAVGDVVTQGGHRYVANTAHTASAAFTTDAVKWTQLSLDPVTSVNGNTGAVTVASASLADRGAWAATTAYVQGDIVTQYGQRFAANTAHTAAAAFTTDNAAGKWTPFPTPVARNYSRNGGPLAFRKALARARTGQGYCRIGAFGDSITYGTLDSGGGDTTNSWPTYLRALLTGAPGLTSVTGFVSPYDASGAVNSGFTVPSGWSVGFGHPNYQSGFANGAAPSGSMTYTATCAGFTLYLGQNGAGAGTYQLDGGTATGFTCTGSTTAKVITVAASQGSHTLTVNYTSGLVMVLGVEPIIQAGSGGISVHNFGQGGAVVTTLTGTTPYGLRTAWALPWDLMTLSYGVNEWNSSVTPATYQTNLTTAVTTLQSYSPTGQVVIVVEPEPTTAGHSPSYPWTQYVAAQYAVADAQGIPLFDPNVRWGPEATRAAAGFGTFHLEKIGYSDFAVMLYNELIS